MTSSAPEAEGVPLGSIGWYWEESLSLSLITQCVFLLPGKEWRIKQPTDECIHQKKHIQIQMKWNLILSSNNLDKSGIDYNYEGKISFCYVMGAKQTVFGTQMIQWVISQYYLTLYYRSEGKHLNQLVHDH